jgi:hypothetical protein
MMTGRMASWTLLAAVAILVAACSPKRAELALDTSEITADSLMSLVEQTGSRVRSIVGRGTVTFESPEVGGTAGFVMNMKKPDSLLVRFEGPFGMDVGMMFLSRDRYVVYNGMQNQVITGVPTTGSLRAVIPFDLTHEQILDAFSGAFSLPENRSSLSAYAIDNDRFYMSFVDGYHRREYWIDHRYLTVARLEVRHIDDNTLVMQASLSSFLEENEATAPRRVVVRFPEERRQVAISYQVMSINRTPPRFAFSIPSNAQTIER